MSLSLGATVAALLGLGLPALADEITVRVHAVSESGVGADVGSVRFADGPYGLSIEPALAGLSPGLHGAHIHQNPACGPSEKDGAAVAGGAAGGHYDPKGTGRHAGPFGDGHLGDLPNLVVEAGGAATMPVVAGMRIFSPPGNSARQRKAMKMMPLAITSCDTSSSQMLLRSQTASTSS